MSEARLGLDILVNDRQVGGGKLLVPFLTAGYPDRETFSALLGAVAGAGCRLLEIGIPFSDPVADGPVIQAASQQALDQGVTMTSVLAMAAEAHTDFGLNVILMGYLNPVLKFGPEAFATACADAGVKGLIIPDLPHEEGAGLRALLAAQGIVLVDLLAPTTDPERLQTIAAAAHGFLYLVSTTGVTGTAGPGDLTDYIERVRAVCTRPLCVGFGISNAEAAASVCRQADGVVIGSALLRLVAAADNGAVAADRVQEFLSAVRAAINPEQEKS